MGRRRSLCFRLLAIAGVLGGILLLEAHSPLATAQAFYGLTDPWSPVVWPPYFRGELQVKPTWMTLQRGQQTIPSFGISWSLRDQFDLGQTNLFIDTMARFQLSRLSFRVAYEVREYDATSPVVGRPDVPEAEARFSYSGIRIGADFDILQRNITRVGVNVDYDLYNPIFHEAVRTIGGKQITGEAATTVGIYAVYNPIISWYGVSPIFEGKVRWPVMGSQVTDLELAAGLATPTTVLGTMALKFGYRRTDLAMKAAQRYNNTAVRTNFDAIMTGWFGELAYYY